MTADSDKAELERRLEQVRRLSSEVSDPLTKERFAELARDIEDQLKKSE